MSRLTLIRLLCTTSLLAALLTLIPLAQAASSPASPPSSLRNTQYAIRPSFALTATKTYTIATDTDSDSAADPGDVLSYTIVITNDGGSTATGLTLSDTLDANTDLSGLVSVSPVVLDDSYNAITNPVTLNVPNGVTDTFTNDYPGLNPAVTGLASFGGGSLPGTAATNLAGSTVNFGTGGSLTVNANGSFNFTPAAGFQGVFTFLYRLQNPVGLSDGLVSLVVDAPPQVVSTNPVSGATGILPSANITLTFNESVTAPAAAFSLECPSGSARPFNVSASPALSFVLTPTTTLPAGVLCQVTVIATQVTDTDGNDPPDNMTGNYVFSFTLPPDAGDDTYGQTVIGNVAINTGQIPYSVVTNDTSNSAFTITAFAATSAQGGQITMTTSGPTMGQFLYNPPPGYEGSDSFTYTIGNATGSDTATVTLTVDDMIWFIDNSQAAAGDGRLTSPFNTLAAFNSINNGSGSNPAAGDNIFIYSGGGAYTGGLSLLDNQRLIGQGATASLAALTGLTPPSGSASLPPTNGADPILNNTGGSVIQIEESNSLVGLSLTANSANPLTAAIFGSSDGGATSVDEVSITTTSGSSGVILNTQGGTFSFSNGSISGGNAAGAVALTGGTGLITFSNTTINRTGGGLIAVLNKSGGSLTFTGGSITGSNLNPSPAFTSVVVLQNNSGLPISFGAGFNITTASGGGLLASNGGSVTIGGSTAAITATNSPAVDAANTTFTATFASLSSSGSTGTGLSLNTISGSFVANGGSITTATGNDVAINGGNGTITYAGLITNTTNRSVEVTGRTGGALTLSGNLNDTGTGVNVANNTGGTITLSGSSKLISTGAITAVTLSSNTGATINFTSGGLDIDTTTATAFSATGGGTVNVTGSGNTINTTSGQGLDLQNTNAGGGGITFAGINSTSGQVANIVSSSGTKTLGRISTSSGATTALNLNNAGTVNVGDALASTLTTTSAAGMTLNASTLNLSGLGLDVTTTGGGTGVSVTGGTVSITGGELDIDTDDTVDGPSFVATSGGTVSVTGSGNTLTSGSQTALNVANTTIGGSNLNFQSISSNGGGNSGIVLNNTGSSGGLMVTGTGAAGTGGTIQNKTIDGISLNNTQNVSLSYMVINNNDGSGIFGDDVTNFSLINSSVTNNADTATGGEAGLRFNELLGVNAITNSTIQGSSEDEVRITPASGTLTNLSISGSTFGPNSATTGGHGIAWIATGTAQGTINVTNNTFQGIRSSSVIMNLTDTGVGTLNVSNNVFRDIGVAVTMGTSSSADLTFNITNNTEIVRSISNAIQLVAGSTSTNASQIRGTISGNVIGDGTADSGSRDMFGIALDMRGDQDAIIRIDSNNVRNTDFEGIWVNSADFGANPQQGRLDLTLTNNMVGPPDDNSGFPVGLIRGTLVDGRHTTTVCMDISSNTSSGIGGGEHFRVRQRDTSIFLLERFSDGDGTPNEVINNVTLVESFIAAQNDAGSTANATLATGFTEAANGFCRKP